MKQGTSNIVMIRPAAFGYNEQTSLNNFFQDSTQQDPELLQQLALQQFTDAVALLRSNAIDVLVLEDTLSPIKPDAVFPNNWFCCNNKTISLFPMYAANRRIEKRPELIEAIKTKTGVTTIQDWSSFEQAGHYLEGTGSMIIDHVFKIIYACKSERTNEDLFYEFCKKNKFTPILFSAVDDTGNDIYHTNVMMCLGENFAVICLDAIEDAIDKKIVVHELVTSGHEIIAISQEQVKQFAGNMLFLINRNDDPILVMSTTALASLSQVQVSALEKHATIIAPDVCHIEKASGGSIRCMMAELFY
jgi:hypothetical protein